MDKWRKGPEELPTEGVEVLTWRDGEYKLAKLSKSRGGYWGDWVETASGGCGCGANWGDEWHAREATYWKPLPEPPEV